MCCLFDKTNSHSSTTVLIISLGEAEGGAAEGSVRQRGSTMQRGVQCGEESMMQRGSRCGGVEVRRGTQYRGPQRHDAEVNMRQRGRNAEV
jgi:hypothetical protein